MEGNLWGGGGVDSSLSYYLMKKQCQNKMMKSAENKKRKSGYVHNDKNKRKRNTKHR